MTLLQTPSGRWAFRFWSAGQLHKREGFRTRGLARAAEWARRVEVGAVTARQAGGPPVVTLAEYVEGWLEQIAPHLAPKTVASYRERLAGHVLPELGGLPLSEITRERVRALLLRARQSQARNSVRLIRAALSACLSDAAERGLIAVNPALGIDRGARRRGERMSTVERYAKVRPMSQAQRDAFLAAAERVAPDWSLYFEMLAKTGIRPGEGLGLRPGDVDVERGTLSVERAWVGGEIRPTKTYEHRTVDVPRDTAARLELELGKPRSLFVADHVFQRVAKVAGLTGFRLYDLRHTYASLRLAAGAPITYVAAQLGHATPATTLRYYARWIPSPDRRWVEEDSAEVHRSRTVVKLETRRK